MTKFRKKPVVIEAVQNNGTKESLAEILRMNAGIGILPGTPDGTYALIINTLEGRMTAQPGDWIIRGVQGEIYPCKPHIFTATYEAVPEEPHP